MGEGEVVMRSAIKFLLIAAVFAGVAVSDSTSFKVHVIGDSTVCNYKDNAYPQTGWGQILGSFFDGSRVQVVNYAIGGRSSKTFVQEGRLDEVKKNLQKGDVMMVQFGHNDRYFGSKPLKVKLLSRVRLFANPWTIACQALLSMEFYRQEYWSGLPFPSPGDLPDPGIEPGYPTLQADTLPSEPPGKPKKTNHFINLNMYTSMKPSPQAR